MSDSVTELLLSHQQITLECRSLSYRPKSKKIKEDILKDVNAKFLPGRLTAILGPSGAGKTSLLNVLTGFKDTGVQGSILVNGTERKICEFRKISSYIPQQFAMLCRLTVLETLQTSADLKIGLKAKKFKKQEVIKQIINLLNLDKCANTLVMRLSGGEKKRLSIGIELVTNPPVMMFDEPTSGLDSVSSLQVLTHLQKLAHSGRTVICVVHQPSSRFLSLFDDIFVLSNGECIYNGTQRDMVKHLQNDGFSCPNYYNPADYVIEVASKEHGSVTSLIASNKINFSEDLELIEVKTDDKADSSDLILNGLKSERSQPFRNKDEYRKAYPATFLEQFSILTRRTMRNSMRDMLTVQLRFIIFPLVGLLMGIVFWDVGNDGAKVLSNASFLFFSIMFIFFGCAMPTVLSCPLETEVFLREHLNNWYPVVAYYFSKFASDLPMQFVCPTSYVVISYYMTGQPYEFERFLMFWAMCLLTAGLGQAFGMLSGSTVGADRSVFLVPASSIPMLIFSGFFIRLNELSEYLQPITYISYFRYCFEGMMQAIYGYDRPDLECNAIFCYYKSTTKLLVDLDMYGDYFQLDVIALVVIIVLFQVLLYVSLIVKVKKSQ